MAMFTAQRLRSAARVAAIHLGISALVALVVAALVFGLWYPRPFDSMIQGRNLFIVLILVDLVCGPLLTLVLFDPAKAKYKWRVDMALIAIVQCAALAYGLNQVVRSRPVFMAFEADRFRVVQADDVVRERLGQAPAALAHLGYGGPRLLGVRLLETTDPAYPLSVQMAMQGIHPSFRPERWVEYASQTAQVQRALKPVAALAARHPGRRDEIDRLVQSIGVSADALGYLPLVREETTDWVVFVRRSDAQPVGYLQMDGWGE